MLCVLVLPTNITAAQLFKSLNDHTSGKWNWSFCAGICTDGIDAKTWRPSGFTNKVKEVASECESMHCVIYREMLATLKLTPELNSIFQDVIKINHINIHALNSRLFMQLCEDMNTEHTRLLLWTEVRWFSKSRLLARVSELWELLKRLLLGKQSPLADISVTQNKSQNLLSCVTYSTCLMNSTCHFREEWQLCSSQQLKCFHSNPNWNYEGYKWT